MVAPQFVGIGGSEISLEALAPIGDDTSDKVIVKVLDAYGRGIDGMAYSWNDWNYDDPCWVDGDWELVKNVKFTAGQGLWVYGSTDTQALQSAGEVSLEDVVVTLRNGGTATGNPFPVAVALQDLVADGDDVSDKVIIKILDAYGRGIAGKEYSWNDWNYDDPCWVDGDWERVEGVEFPAGQGLWVYGSIDKTDAKAQYLRIPAPEL